MGGLEAECHQLLALHMSLDPSSKQDLISR